MSSPSNPISLPLQTGTFSDPLPQESPINRITASPHILQNTTNTTFSVIDDYSPKKELDPDSRSPSSNLNHLLQALADESPVTRNVLSNSEHVDGTSLSDKIEQGGETTPGSLEKGAIIPKSKFSTY